MAQRKYNLKRTIETKVRKSQSLCGILRDLCKDKHFLDQKAMTAVKLHQKNSELELKMLKT
jgi:hypothetical protein